MQDHDGDYNITYFPLREFKYKAYFEPETSSNKRIKIFTSLQDAIDFIQSI